MNKIINIFFITFVSLINFCICYTKTGNAVKWREISEFEPPYKHRKRTKIAITTEEELDTPVPNAATNMRGVFIYLPDELILSVMRYLSDESLKSFALTSRWSRDFIENEQVHRLTQFIKQTLIRQQSKRLEKILYSITDTWHKNMIDFYDASKSQMMVCIKERSKAKNLLTGLYVSLSEGIKTTRLALIYGQLFKADFHEESAFLQRCSLLRYSYRLFPEELPRKYKTSLYRTSFIENLSQMRSDQLMAIINGANIILKPQMGFYERNQVVELVRFLNLDANEINQRTEAIDRNANILFIYENSEPMYPTFTICSALIFDANEIDLRAQAILQNYSILFPTFFHTASKVAIIAIALHLNAEEINRYSSTIITNVPRLIQCSHEEVRSRIIYYSHCVKGTLCINE